jgi:hypothetical protein
MGIGDFFKKQVNKQLELGKQEREKLSNQEPVKPKHQIQAQRSEEDIIRDYKERRKEKRRNIFIGIVCIFALLYAIGSSADSENSTQSPYPEIEENLTNWIPVGFNSWTEDSNVAWRWLEDKEYKCDYDRACTGIMVVAKDGCSRNLYAEVSILDKKSVQIGYTNDTVSSALSMQESKLVFNTYEEGANSFRLSKISCY